MKHRPDRIQYRDQINEWNLQKISCYYILCILSIVKLYDGKTHHQEHSSFLFIKNSLDKVSKKIECFGLFG